ncbi:MAG TPA: ParA family protein [Chloroflexota bacterium]|nr:ParA family protein [Chloroflexota bacterium]
MAARIITVANQKGGVGKTTTTVSIGAELAERFRVLLIDLDPQANATSSLGLTDPERERSTYDALLGNSPLADVVIETDIPNLALAPAVRALAGAQIELVDLPNRERRLERALEPLLGATQPDQARAYDLVLIDTPPSLGLLTLNALAASDHVLIPVQSEYLALEGLGQIVETLELVRGSINPRLGLIGILLTMLDARTNLGQQVGAEVRRHFPAATFQTEIPRSVRLSEAPSFGRPIRLHDPSSRGALAYAALTEELLGRLGMRPPEPPTPQPPPHCEGEGGQAAGAMNCAPTESADVGARFIAPTTGGGLYAQP